MQATCDARFPELGVVVSDEDRVLRWAKVASAEVTRAKLDPDPANAGGVLVTLAGASGAVSSGAVTTVQAYFDDIQGITDLNTAQNSSNLQITGGGTVLVPRAQDGTMQPIVDAAWNALLVQSTIGAQVRLTDLIKVVMDAGALDFTGALLNGSPANVVLSSNQVPVPNPALLATLLTWTPV